MSKTYERFAFLNSVTGELKTGDGGAILNSKTYETALSSLKHCMNNADLEICQIKVTVKKVWKP